MQEETISAVITALGEGAVGVIRISGENALAVGEKLFHAASGKSLADYAPNTMVYGHVYDTSFIIPVNDLQNDIGGFSFKVPTGSSSPVITSVEYYLIFHNDKDHHY